MALSAKRKAYTQQSVYKKLVDNNTQTHKFVYIKYPALGEEADSLPQLAVKPTAATKFGARCATLRTTNFMCVLYDLRMCVHGYTHTHTHTHKQTHTQTHI